MPIDLSEYEVESMPLSSENLDEFTVDLEETEKRKKQILAAAITDPARMVGTMMDTLTRGSVASEAGEIEQARRAARKAPLLAEMERTRAEARELSAPILHPGTETLPQETYEVAGKRIGKEITQAGRDVRTTAEAAALAATAPFVSGGIDDAMRQLQGSPAPGEDLPYQQGYKKLSYAGQLAADAAGGLLESAPRIAAMSALTPVTGPAVAGGLAFGFTEEGFSPKEAAIGALLPSIGKYSGEIAGRLATRLGISDGMAMKVLRAAGHVGGPVAYLSTIQASEIAGMAPEDRPEAIKQAVASNIGFLALSFPGGVKELTRVVPKWQGPIATGANLPVKPALPQLGPRTPTPREAELLRSNVPQPPRATVPGTAAEPERGMSVVEEIRTKDARTKEQIQKLFPGISREQAGDLRIRAWGTAGDFGVRVSPTIPIPAPMSPPRGAAPAPPAAERSVPVPAVPIERQVGELTPDALNQQIITWQRELDKALANKDGSLQRIAIRTLMELRQQLEGPGTLTPGKPAIVPKAPLPNVPRNAIGPEVPATPPEAERGMTVLQEIRAKNARTKEQVRALFPQLTRERAAALRDEAWKNQPEVAAEAPAPAKPAEPVPIPPTVATPQPQPAPAKAAEAPQGGVSLTRRALSKLEDAQMLAKKDGGFVIPDPQFPGKWAVQVGGKPPPEAGAAPAGTPVPIPPPPPVVPGVSAETVKKAINIEASDHPEVAKSNPDILPTLVKDELKLDKTTYDKEKDPGPPQPAGTSMDDIRNLRTASLEDAKKITTNKAIELGRKITKAEYDELSRLRDEHAKAQKAALDRYDKSKSDADLDEYLRLSVSSQFYNDVAEGFEGGQKPGAEISTDVRRAPQPATPESGEFLGVPLDIWTPGYIGSLQPENRAALVKMVKAAIPRLGLRTRFVGEPNDVALANAIKKIIAARKAQKPGDEGAAGGVPIPAPQPTPVAPEGKAEVVPVPPAAAPQAKQPEAKPPPTPKPAKVTKADQAALETQKRKLPIAYDASTARMENGKLIVTKRPEYGGGEWVVDTRKGTTAPYGEAPKKPTNDIELLKAKDAAEAGSGEGFPKAIAALDKVGEIGAETVINLDTKGQRGKRVTATLKVTQWSDGTWGFKHSWDNEWSRGVEPWSGQFPTREAAIREGSASMKEQLQFGGGATGRGGQSLAGAEKNSAVVMAEVKKLEAQYGSVQTKAQKQIEEYKLNQKKAAAREALTELTKLRSEWNETPAQFKSTRKQIESAIRMSEARYEMALKEAGEPLPEKAPTPAAAEPTAEAEPEPAKPEPAAEVAKPLSSPETKPREKLEPTGKDISAEALTRELDRVEMTGDVSIEEFVDSLESLAEASDGPLKNDISKAVENYRKASVSRDPESEIPATEELMGDVSVALERDANRKEAASKAAEPEPIPQGLPTMPAAVEVVMGVPKEVGEATVALVEAMGLDKGSIQWAAGGKPGKGALLQLSPKYTRALEKAIKEGKLSIKMGPLEQSGRGSVEFREDGTALIRALKNPDASTGVHEIFHVARNWLLDRNIPVENRRGITDEHIAVAEEWAGAKDGNWTVEAEEKFARGGERYLLDGTAPNSMLADIFSKFKGWLSDIYSKISGSPVDLKISPEMRKVYDALVTRGEAGELAKSPEPAPVKDPMFQAESNLDVEGKSPDALIREFYDEKGFLQGRQFTPEQLERLADRRKPIQDAINKATERALQLSELGSEASRRAVRTKEGEIDWKQTPVEDIQAIFDAENAILEVIGLKSRLAEQSPVTYPPDRLIRKRYALEDRLEAINKGKAEASDAEVTKLEKELWLLRKQINDYVPTKDSPEPSHIFSDAGNLYVGLPFPALKPLLKPLANLRGVIVQRMKNMGARHLVDQLADAVDNKSNILGQQMGNKIRLGKTPTQQVAASAVIAAGYDLAELPKLLAMVKGKNSDAAAGIQYAIDNFSESLALAKLGQKVFDWQIRTEQNSGINTMYAENYLPGLYDRDIWTGKGLPYTIGAKSGGLSTSFKKGKTFASPFHAIGDPSGNYTPQTLRLGDLIEHRVRSGQRLINRKVMGSQFKQVMAPSDGKPVVTDVELVKRDPGQPSYERVPMGYEPREIIPGTRIAVHSDFTKLFDAVTGRQSAVAEWEPGGIPVGEIALQTEGAIKHGLLVADTFHASRILQKEVFLNAGLPSYKKGYSLLEYSNTDLNRAVAAGEITPKIADWVRTNRPVARELLNAGLNVGRIQEAMYSSFVRDVQGKIAKGVQALGVPKSMTGAIEFNKWVFEKVTRGAMMESALIAHARVKAQNPTWSSTKVAEVVARDINVFFGNLGRQGLFKSPTMLDVSRLAFLAPQWVESMLRSEVLGTAQIGKGIWDTATKRRVMMGTLGTGLAQGVAAYVVATQLLNQFTRGQFTWENKEEGHKLDAWIPDVTGKGPGFFVSPLSVPAELTHDMLRYPADEKESGTAAKVIAAANHIRRNRQSPLWRAGSIVATGRDWDQQKIQGAWNKAKAAAWALAPTPIPLSPLIRGNAPQGQMQRQLTASMGIKTEPAKSALAQISSMAREWMADNRDPKIKRKYDLGLKNEFGMSDYVGIRRALSKEDYRAAAEEYSLLRETKKPAAIAEALRPYTITLDGQMSQKPVGGLSRDETSKFLRTLTPDERKLWDKSRAEKREEYNRFLKMLREFSKQKPGAAERLGVTS